MVDISTPWEIPGSGGSQTPTTTIIAPPDDRYLPGYTSTDADGNEKTVGPRLKDLNIPFSLYGIPIPITFGVRRLYGNIIWAIPLRENIKKSKSGGGKGGGGPTTKKTTYQYFATFAVGFGYPGNTDTTSRNIIRVWADGTLIFDRRGTGRVKTGAFNYKFYDGSETQEPDPTMIAKEGAGNVPGYRGLMYMVIKDLPVGDFGDRPPRISVELGDVTEQDYIIKNIATPTIVDAPSSRDIGPDFSTGIFYRVAGNGAIGTHIRRYNMLTKTYMGHVPLNDQDGVGWLNNDTDTSASALAHLKGARLTTREMAYIPWLGKFFAFAGDVSGCNPVMLIDASSGAVTHWSGCKNGFVNWVIPAVSGGQTPKGLIPGPKSCFPTLLLGPSGMTNIFVIGSIYGGFGVMAQVMEGPIEIIMWDTAGQVVAGCPGEVGINYSAVYVARGSKVSKIEASGTVQRLGDAWVGIVVQDNWMTLPSNVFNLLNYQNDNSLIIFYGSSTTAGNWRVRKVDMTTKTVIWDIEGTILGPPTQTNWWLSDISAGTAAWHRFGSFTAYELDLVFGDMKSYANSTFNGAAAPSFHDSSARCIWGVPAVGDGIPVDKEGLAGALSAAFYDRISDARMPLATFILGMALYAGYQESQIYVDPAIDDTIDGAIISNVTTFKNVIDAIKAVYRIDVIESNGQVKFLRQAIGSSNVVYDIPENDLVANPVQPETASHQARREREVSTPERIILKYIDKSLGYQWGAQQATRSRFIQTNNSSNQMTYELPIIMNAAEAKQMAQRVLWSAWTSRIAHAFTLPPKYLAMEPGDIGKITARGITYLIKAVTLSYNANFTIGVKAQNFQTDEPMIVVADTGTGYEQELPPYSPSEIHILDIPLLRSSDDLSFSGNSYPLYMYGGPVLLETPWPGAVLEMSRDYTTFTEIASNNVQGFVGVATTTLAAPESANSIDTVSTVAIFPRAGDLDLLVGCTESELLDGKNISAFGRSGRWELIQFQTVTVNDDGSYTLSNLLRGRRGTEKHMDHQAGDYLVMLDPSWADATTLNFGDVNKFIDFKAVGFGQFSGNVLPNRVQIIGYGALPWPVTAIRAQRSISGDGDITLSWARRSRVSGELIDGGELATLTAYELNDYRITLWRWPHVDYAWNGSAWVVVTDSSNDTHVIDVTGAQTLALSDSVIRTGELYEWAVPDNFALEGTTFTQVGGATLPENASQNLQMVDLGYSAFMAFKYLDIMIQQKTTVPNGSGYGPGRRMRIYIEDT